MFGHIPVLLEETVSSLNIKDDGVYWDGTCGGGSHSFAIGEKLTENGMLICSDRDIDAIHECESKLSCLSCRKEIIKTEFSNIPELISRKGIRPNGIMLDLGVSSHQLDEADRGFSYMADARLDMRMDQDSPKDAEYVINTYSTDELERIFSEYGEEKFSGRIARAISEKRKEHRIQTTGELVDIIKSVMPAQALREKQHPAKRVFQAVRIEVNEELVQIRTFLDSVIPLLADGGRLSIITFHSLEDRIVKNAFATAERPCTCPPEFPVCVCGKKSLGTVVTRKPIVPSDKELEINPRSRSAKLRVFERRDQVEQQS